MVLDERHCLPDRVRKILTAINASAPGESERVDYLVAEGCQCASARACMLWDACQSIHKAFTRGRSPDFRLFPPP